MTRILRFQRLRAAAVRAAIALISVALTLLLIEIGIRLFYGSLPGELRLALRFVRQTPFTDERLAPLPLWHSDTDYQMIARPGARDVLQVGSLNVQFRVSTYSWWGGRVGFRTPPPETGEVAGVALGDSHTFCFVEIEDCWVSILNAQTGLNIANLGQPATGSVSHARRFYDFVAKPELNLGQPKLVLWQFFGNDYNDDFGLALLNGTNQTPPPEDRQESLPLAENPLGRWLGENSAIYTMLVVLPQIPLEHTRWFIDPYKVRVSEQVMEFGRPYLTAALDMSQERNREGERLSRGAILRTREIVTQNGGQFIMLLMPTKEEVYRPLTEPLMGKAAIDALAEPRLRMAEFCRSQALTCFDLAPALEAAARQNIALFHADDLHLNAEGNRVAAEAIAVFLREQGVIPP